MKISMRNLSGLVWGWADKKVCAGNREEMQA